MAFNEGVNELQMPNLTGRSQGTGPNRVFESLFGGLSDTFQNVTTVKDKGTQRAIEEDARAGFESVNQDFGLVPPADMQSELDRVSTLQAARSQGKISETNYYGRLATLSKQLRAKYPRYEGIVDATIQSVTGTRPANAYRDALFGEMNALAKDASDETKYRRRYEDENAGEITTIFPDYFSNPDKYDFNQVQAKVAQRKGEIYTIDSQKKMLDLRAKQGEMNETEATKVLSQEMAFLTQSELNRTINANGVTFEQSLQTFVSSGMAGAELDTMIGQVAETETRMRSTLMAKSREYVAKGWLTNDAANKAVDAAMYPITEAKKALVGGDFTYAARFATINKVIADRSLNEIFKKSPDAVVGAGLSKMNETVGAEFFAQKMSQFDNLALEITGQVMMGSDPKIVENVVKSGDQKTARAMLGTALETIKNPSVAGEDLTNLMSQFFGPNAVDLMSGDVVNSEDLEKMYTMLLDPKVTEAIKQKGTPEDLRLYTEFALEKARAIPSFRAAAGNLNTVTGQMAEAKLSYDPTTNRIDIKTATSGAGFGNIGNKRILQSLVGSMNKTLAVLDPIAKANGAETQQMLQELIGSMVEMEKQPGKGIFSWMLEQMSMEAGASENGGGTSVQEISVDSGEIDFVQEALAARGRRTNPSQVPDRNTADILDMIGQSEGAGYDTLFGYSERKYGAVPTQMTLKEVLELQDRMASDLGSSAVGKYQIMRYTLRDAIKALGLPLDTVFDEETQDRIATDYLLARRGYNEYKSGQLSKGKFLNNLAQEWASIPTASGESFYAGDKMGNKASRGGRKLAATI